MAELAPWDAATCWRTGADGEARIEWVSCSAAWTFAGLDPLHLVLSPAAGSHLCGARTDRSTAC